MVSNYLRKVTSPEKIIVDLVIVHYESENGYHFNKEKFALHILAFVNSVISLSYSSSG